MGKDLLKQIASAIASALVKSGGVKAWIFKKAMYYGGQYLYDLVTNVMRKLERKKEQEKTKEILDEKLNDPTAPPEETAKAYENFINSGRPK
jgi:hypothetical protein